MDENDLTLDPRRLDRRTLYRRQFLKATGVAGVAALATGTASAQSGGPYAERVEIGPFDAATVEPGVDVAEADPPTDSDLQGGQQGSAEEEELPRLTPEAQGEPGNAGRGTVLSSDTDVLDVERAFDGFDTRDVVRGVDLDDDGTVTDAETFFSVPGDPVVAAGPDHLVTAVNNEIGILPKDVPDGTDRTAADVGSGDDYIDHYRAEDWFGDVIDPFLPQGRQGQFENYLTTDPRVRYDPDAERFYVAWVLYNLPDTVPDGDDEDDDPDPVADPGDDSGAYLLSVSSSSDPTEPWYNYRIEPANNDGLVDYPAFGYDADALYLTQNRFAPGFAEATFDVVDKEAALAGEPVSVYEFRGLRNPGGGLAFTVQPADMPGESGAAYATNSLFFQGQTLGLWTVTGAPDDPELTNQAVRVGPYTNPPQGTEQPGTEDKIDMGDDRLLDATYDPASGTVWTTHTANDGSVRWYELDPATGRSVQQMTFKRQGLRTFYPAVGTNGESTLFVYNVAGPNQGQGDYAGIEVAGRTAGYRAGDLEDYAVVQEGETTYDYVNPGEGDTSVQVMRWGDYNAVAVDPDDDSYWVVAQYAKSGPADETEIYGTRIANVAFDG